MFWPGTWAEIIAIVEPRSWLTGRSAASFSWFLENIEKTKALSETFQGSCPGLNKDKARKTRIIEHKPLINMYYCIGHKLELKYSLLAHFLLDVYLAGHWHSFTWGKSYSGWGLGSGPRYMICVTLFCMLSTRPCKNGSVLRKHTAMRE